MKTIYISGKISGVDPKLSEQNFSQAEEKLKKLGFKVVNPMTLKHNHDKSWESFMREDIKALMKCDAIYMLDGWVQSRGAWIEKELSEDLKFDVYFETKTDEENDFKI